MIFCRFSCGRQLWSRTSQISLSFLGGFDSVWNKILSHKSVTQHSDNCVFAFELKNGFYLVIWLLYLRFHSLPHKHLILLWCLIKNVGVMCSTRRSHFSWQPLELKKSVIVSKQLIYQTLGQWTAGNTQQNRLKLHVSRVPHKTHRCPSGTYLSIDSVSVRWQLTACRD